MRYTKAIKSLGKNVTWVSVSIDFSPYHIFSCYLQPQEPENNKETIRRILGYIDGFRERLPNSNFIVGGDFNENRAEMKLEMQRRNISPILVQGSMTHEKGGQLD